MNIIEAMRLPVGTKLESSIYDEKVFKIYEQDGVKVLRPYGDFRGVSLGSDITEAEYYIVR